MHVTYDQFRVGIAFVFFLINLNTNILIITILMQFKKQILATVALIGLVATSCIDDKYDLSDIDTNVRVDVTDLVIPVNVDEITLKSVFDVKEDDRIQVVNGEYAVIENGDFTSDVVKIDAIVLPSPVIDPTVTTINTGFGGISIGNIPSKIIELPFNTPVTEFSAATEAVSSSIISIKEVGTDFNITVSIAIREFAGKLSSFELKNLVLQLPSGLQLTSKDGSYNPATGEFTAHSIVSSGNKVIFAFNVSKVDYEQSKMDYTYSSDIRKLVFEDKMYVKSAVLSLNTDNITGIASIPSQLTLDTKYEMSDVRVTDFSGRIKYEITGTEISDVDLSNLPDVFAQSGTDIRIANPQIYLSVNNPLESYRLRATAGLTITSYHNGAEPDKYSLDAPGYFTVPGDPGKGIYNFYMSPETVKDVYEGYDGAEHVGFKSLSNVLSGDGLPKRLGVQLDNPSLPEQDVTGFRLGEDLGAVNGRYTFLAPVQLGADSKIVYSDDVDGWSDDELENVTITTLSINAVVSTDVPVAIDFTGYPIDKDGNRINNVEIVGAKIDANANNQQLAITITGEINKLDGIHFQAVATAGKDAGVLRPDMNIRVGDIRAKVSGYYEKEL